MLFIFCDFKPMEYFFSKLSDATMYDYSKQAVMNASDYTKTAFYVVKILMKLTQC